MMEKHLNDDLDLHHTLTFNYTGCLRKKFALAFTSLVNQISTNFFSNCSPGIKLSIDGLKFVLAFILFAQVESP